MIAGRLGFSLPALLLSSVLSSCAWLTASPDSAAKNVRLRGTDPVGYFTAGIAMPGRAELTAEHDGATYRFANETNRRLFIANPERFMPQFDGFCANRMVYAQPVAGGTDAFKIIDGRLYLFSSRSEKQYFEMDQGRNLRLATHYWTSEVRDSTLWWQSLKRQIFHVPHYKSSDELAAEYRRRLAGNSG
ncbi:MAG TPA: YHS domain-containing (seleno)protein [Burkholderiales bacterium]|jgi:YHS domain-containing protein|nr:YHS domain-containing (seleno)protein [Burkholderiales bacterium]